jgi:hypothetical protein
VGVDSPLFRTMVKACSNGHLLQWAIFVAKEAASMVSKGACYYSLHQWQQVLVCAELRLTATNDWQKTRLRFSP